MLPVPGVGTGERRVRLAPKLLNWRNRQGEANGTHATLPPTPAFVEFRWPVQIRSCLPLSRLLLSSCHFSIDNFSSCHSSCLGISPFPSCFTVSLLLRFYYQTSNTIALFCWEFSLFRIPTAQDFLVPLIPGRDQVVTISSLCLASLTSVSREDSFYSPAFSSRVSSSCGPQFSLLPLSVLALLLLLR